MVARVLSRVSTGEGERACSDFLREVLIDTMDVGMETAESLAGEETGNLINSIEWSDINPSFNPNSQEQKTTTLQAHVPYSKYHEKHTKFMARSIVDMIQAKQKSRLITFSYIVTIVVSVRIAGRLTYITKSYRRSRTWPVFANAFIRLDHDTNDNTAIVTYVAGCPFVFNPFPGWWSYDRI